MLTSRADSRLVDGAIGTNDSIDCSSIVPIDVVIVVVVVIAN